MQRLRNRCKMGENITVDYIKTIKYHKRKSHF